MLKPITCLCIQNDDDSKIQAQGCSSKSNDAEYVYDLYYIQPGANDIDVDDLLLDGLVR